LVKVDVQISKNEYLAAEQADSVQKVAEFDMKLIN
jgi:hypothetical protein